MHLRLAAAAFPLERIPAPGAWQARLDAMVRTAVDGGARLVLFPEYVTAPLLALDADWGRWTALWQGTVADLARRHGCWVAGGTHLVPGPDGLRNRALVAGPDGACLHQDKLHPTSWERTLGVAPTPGFRLFAVDGAQMALAVCYDVEFPEAVRAMARAGAEVLLVPSWTDDDAGFHRVRRCAAARCVENSLAVVHAPLVGLGEVPGFEQAVGTAGILTPCDAGWPPAGVAASGEPGRPGVIVADLDLGRLRQARRAGTVTPFADHRPEASYVLDRGAPA